MISQNNYSLTEFMKTKHAGVTLLIAILILSTVLAISFSLATILLAEARNSGDLLHTEPALYADNAISEEALYNVSRATGVTTYSSNVGILPVTSTATLLNDPVQQVKIPSGNTSYGCTTNCYVLYNPVDPYGAGGYGRIKITFIDTGVSSARLHIYLCQWDPLNPPTNPDGTYKNVCSDPTDSSYMSFQDTNPSPLSPGQTWDSSLNCGGCMDQTGSKQQQLVLYQTNSGQPANVYAQISTFDSSGNPRGIPYFGETAVNISSTNAGVNRNIKVVVPNTSSYTGATVPGQIILTTDNAYTAYFNGNQIGTGSDWTAAGSYAVSFNSGKNVVAVIAVDSGGCYAGVLGDISYGSNSIGTNTSWKVSSNFVAGWQDPNFNDTSWPNATDYGAYGSPPWSYNVAGMPASTPGHWIWANSVPCGGGTLYLRGTINN